MAGLPPVTGTITTTVQLVEDPGFTDPPPPLPALPVTDPAVQARLAEMRLRTGVRQIAFVSATVYDHSRTFLKCYLLATPPQPEDVTIQYWKRNHPSPRGEQALKGKGNP